MNITEAIDGGLEGVPQMKVQSNDWLRRMKYSIQILKIQENKASDRLRCTVCNYSSF